MENYETKFNLTNITEEGEFSGYASVFGNVDRGSDVIKEGAFDQAVADFHAKKSIPKMLWQHSAAYPVGIWNDMEIDSRGLKVKGKLLLDLAKASDIHVLMKNKAIDGLSIGFKTISKELTEQEDGRITRVLTKIDLWEISIVTFPMNPEATVTDVKNLSTALDVERLLQKSGVPNKFAKLVAQYGYDGAIERVNAPSGKGNRARKSGEAKSLLTEIKNLKEIINGT